MDLSGGVVTYSAEENISTPLMVYLISPTGDCLGVMNRSVRLKRAKEFSKTLGEKILKMKMLGAKILKFCLKRLPLNQQTSKRHINMIRLTFICYKKYLRGTHPCHEST